MSFNLNQTIAIQKIMDLTTEAECIRTLAAGQSAFVHNELTAIASSLDNVAKDISILIKDIQ